MRDFKTGDKIVCIDNNNREDRLSLYELYTVTEVEVYSWFIEIDGFHFDKSRFEHAMVDCKLNRALYPELVPKDGYLIRREE